MAMTMYECMLVDIDGMALRRAITILLATGSAFFPKIAEIRNAAIMTMEPIYPTPLEAWNMVTSGDWSCEIATQTFQSLDLGGRSISHMDYASADRHKSLFVYEYRARVAREKERHRLPPRTISPLAITGSPAQRLALPKRGK